MGYHFFFYFLLLALTIPDAVFLEGETNPVEVCATLNAPTFPSSIFFDDPFVVNVTFTEGSAG